MQSWTWDGYLYTPKSKIVAARVRNCNQRTTKWQARKDLRRAARRRETTATGSRERGRSGVPWRWDAINQWALVNGLWLVLPMSSTSNSYTTAHPFLIFLFSGAKPCTSIGGYTSEDCTELFDVFRVAWVRSCMGTWGCKFRGSYLCMCLYGFGLWTLPVLVWLYLRVADGTADLILSNS